MYKILVPVTVLLILLPQILARHHNEFVPRIIGGYSCDTLKVPFFVIILHRTGCGGSLLTTEWVLTASHCLLPRHLQGVTAQIHSGFDLEPELRQIRHIQEVHRHPNFNEEAFMPGDDLRFDIGLILLNEPFTQTSVLQIGTFPAPGFTKQCIKVMAAGIGLTYSGEDISVTAVEQRPLLCVNLSIVNNCQKSFPNAIFDENIFCAYAPKKDTCGGDSGGPILCDGVIIGIVSYGPTPCGVSNRSATYTMIEGYYDFINPIINFSGIKMKHARAYHTSDGNDKSVNNTSGNDKRANGASGNDRKEKKARASAVQARVANWNLIFVTLLCYFYNKGL